MNLTASAPNPVRDDSDGEMRASKGYNLIGSEFKEINLPFLIQDKGVLVTHSMTVDCENGIGTLS